MKKITQQIEKAQNALSELCKNPNSFTMRIPANEEKDTDLIIAKALYYAKEMVIALEKIASQTTDENSKIIAINVLSQK